MNDPTTAIPSDLRTHRHPIQIDDDGRLFALQVQGAQQGAVILLTREGGLAVLPGTTIEQLQRPTADEPGAGRLAAALKRLSALEIDDLDGAEALPIDRLEAALEEYGYYLRNVKPDLEGWRKDIDQAESAMTTIATMAVDVLTSGDPSKYEPMDVPGAHGRTIGAVMALANTAIAWRDGAAALAREGLLEVGARQGPAEFFKALRWQLAQLRQDLAIEEGKTANLSAELARRLKRDAEHDAGAQAFEPDNGRALARLEADLATIAADTAIAVLDSMAPHPPTDIGGPAELHQIRVMIHHDVLRVVVADDLDPEILEHIEVEVGDKIGDRLGLDSTVLVQAEPGQAAPGFLVRGGEATGAEAPTLRWYWRHSSDDATDERGPLASEAAAVDATWDQAAADAREYQGEEP